MNSYKVELSQKQGRWHAVIIDLLVVGEGPDPETATADAVRKARGQEDALLSSGLAYKLPDGSVRVMQRTGDIARRVGVEYGIRAIFLFAVIAAVFLMIRGDLKSEAARLRSDIIYEISLLRQAIDGSAFDDASRVDRFRARARKLNDRLQPIAEELRPLFRTLLGDDAPDNSRQSSAPTK